MEKTTEKERYIITREQAEEYAKLWAEERTADSAPISKVYDKYFVFLSEITKPSKLSEHDEKVRNEVLDELEEKIDRYMISDPTARNHRSIHESVWGIIRSLRKISKKNGE